MASTSSSQTVTDQNTAAPQQPKKKPRSRVDPANSALHKRQPPRLPKRKNDIYVTRKSNFAAQLRRCEKLLDSGENELCIHGLGAAINRALNVALQLEARGLGTLRLSVSTDTIDLVDDLEPLCDEGDFDSRERSNSAVNIRLFRTESKDLEASKSTNK